MTMILVEKCPGRLAPYSMQSNGSTVAGFLVWEHPDDNPGVTGIPTSMTPDERKEIEADVWTAYHRTSGREGGVRNGYVK